MPKEYPAEFKTKIIKRYQKGESIQSLSQELHIAQSTLYDWRREYCSIKTANRTYTPKEFDTLSRRLEKLEHESVIDGVNVPARVYRISTNVTVHGGTINAGDTITEKSKKTGVKVERTATERLDFSPTQLDRSITNPKQIETVLAAYRDAIYTDLYPDRAEKWEYIPKTLIFAKDDNHATEIVNEAIIL